MASGEIDKRSEAFLEYSEQTLNKLSNHIETYNKRSGRTYYPLNEGWGLTNLDTGEPFFVNTKDRHVTPWVIMGGHWEPNVERVLIGYARPGDTILDIGAHIGYYTIKFGSRVGPQGRVIAFEPNPEVTEYAIANIRLNNFFSTVNLECVALGDNDGTATLSRSAHAMASANIVGDLDESKINVPLRTLDSFAIERPVDLIKIDVEGSEGMVLSGAQELLKKSPECAIALELSLPRWERFNPLANLVELCGSRGRQVYGIHSDGTIEQMSMDALRAFIMRGHFQEEYVLLAHPRQIEMKIPELVRRPLPVKNSAGSISKVIQSITSSNVFQKVAQIGTQSVEAATRIIDGNRSNSIPDEDILDNAEFRPPTNSSKITPIIIGNRHPVIVPDSDDRNGAGQFFTEDITLEPGSYAAKIIIIFSELWHGEHADIQVEYLDPNGTAVVAGVTRIAKGGPKGDVGIVPFTLPESEARLTVRITGRTTKNCSSTALRLLTVISAPHGRWSESEFHWGHEKPAEISKIEVVFITPCGKCNASCIHCPVNKDDRPPVHSMMPMTLFKKIVDELAMGGFCGVVLFSPFAESLADPHLVERVKYMRSMLSNASIWVATNAALFDERKHSEIFDYIDMMAIHVMSADPEKYDHFMAPLKSTKVFPKIDRILEACLQNNKITVELNCPVHKENVEDLALLAERFPVNKRIQYNYFGFSGRCSETGIFPKLSLAPIGSVCQPAITQNFLVVDWDGSVLPCTDDFYRSNILGNLTTQTIEEVYLSEKWGEFREKLRRSDYHKLGSCAKCRKDATFALTEEIHGNLVKNHPRAVEYTANAFRAPRYATRELDSLFIPATRENTDIAIWGPYVHLPRGRYVITHRIESTAPKSDERRLDLDVSLSYGLETVAAYQFEVLAGTHDYSIEFEHDSLAVTEFRIIRHGGFPLKYHGAKLVRLE